ncbi:MAG: undecaprenyldiphospho-muramoylpentapeptide beta-N-acetylglucosaminyltransferase [Lachnospiraceae bacterium]|jgi:UDP-N-acetylglucosamine--N-acetylmuramyl-(pentapeptide) pyrophosphoryl-undecaprenol N-acetylglucosamine transferase|nr:undecaprenyldiphospho-muramoylpentapeptide beta-N-acetylglucosaminyltransferase [Lachnospiraceae bacterium]
MSKKIVLTGGGTAGHVTPNIALIPKLQEEGYEVSYIGSYEGIEKELIEEVPGVKYYGISSGKLRRYLSAKNISDAFRVLKGLREAKKLMKKINPDIVFSKGGFVAVPVVFAGAGRKIPIIIHESDMTPGLANKLSFPKASKICCNFPETLNYLPESKAILTGSPIREELLHGEGHVAKKSLGITSDKPVILVMGGSLGAVAVNEAIRRILPTLLEKYIVIHICGRGKIDDTLYGLSDYIQLEYVKDELKDIFALADVMVSRAGANAICEILALAKPNLLIPLSKAASRGDQILNARSFEKQGFSEVLEEEDITDELLLEKIENLFANRASYEALMKTSNQNDAINKIMGLIEGLLLKNNP